MAHQQTNFESNYIHLTESRMKNILHNRSERKSFLSSKLYAICVLLAFSAITVFGQQAKPTKEELELKKFESQLKIAKMNLAKAEKAANISDSLMTKGDEMIKEGEAEKKELNAQLKSLEKEYNASVKPLNKQMGSKDKETATEAKNEFKALDVKYKADVKDVNTKLKAAEKKMLTGESNYGKGKATSKTSATSLKTAQENVANIEAKIDALNGGGDESDEPVGKKKKKKD
jgi:hypothetical protein